MIEYELYDWTSLIDDHARKRMTQDIDYCIEQGWYWKNSPPYQTDKNVFGFNGPEWNNLKMSFIWSCFAYMGKERQIKAVKSWGYKTNVDTQEDRNTYWHQHLRPDATVLSGVYYIQLPESCNTKTSGTELAHKDPHGDTTYAPWFTGQWLIFPGKTWHRPGVLESKEWRYIVAADMEV